VVEQRWLRGICPLSSHILTFWKKTVFLDNLIVKNYELASWKSSILEEFHDTVCGLLIYNINHNKQICMLFINKLCKTVENTGSRGRKYESCITESSFQFSWNVMYSVGQELTQMSFNSRVNSVTVNYKLDLIHYLCEFWVYQVSKLNSLQVGSLGYG